MVSPRRQGERGASSFGCLVSLLLFVAALYYGVNIGELYFRYYRLEDAMREQARFAQALDDATMRRRIQAAIQDIGIPDEAETNLQIRRTALPREITIESSYSESVHLPLFDHTFNFNPSVTSPL